MDNEKLLMAVVNVLARKQIVYDSFMTEEMSPAFNRGGDEDGMWQRTFSLTFTEILQGADFKKANEQGERFQTVYEQIRDEYNRLTSHDMEGKKTGDSFEVSAHYLK